MLLLIKHKWFLWLLLWLTNSIQTNTIPRREGGSQYKSLEENGLVEAKTQQKFHPATPKYM